MALTSGEFTGPTTTSVGIVGEFPMAHNSGIELSSVRNILVIKLRAIGDVVLSTIVLKNLRSAFPQAHVDFLTEPGGAGVLKGNPFIDELVVFRKQDTSGFGLVTLVRNRRYDLVIDLFGNPRTALVTRLSGARHRVGYRFRGRAYAYNHLVEPRGDRVHNTQFNLDALAAIDVPIVDRNLHIVPSGADEARAEQILAETVPARRRIVALVVSGGWTIKRWPLDRFAELGDYLVGEFNAHVLLPWGPGEQGDVEQVRARMKGNATVLPATTLLEMASVLKRCSFVVANDSGPMHIAAAMGTPVLGIYGPTLPVLQGPYGDQHRTIRNERLTCLGCNRTTCPIGDPCMLELSVQEVLAAVRTLADKSGLRV
jgi:lipopolysaccharide heptosyltransferase II